MTQDKESPFIGKTSAASTISQKLAALKQTIQFDAALKPRLSKALSPRELLLFVHEELLFRFANFREIGLMDSDSFQIIESLRERVEGALARLETSGPDEGQLDAEELYNQVVALKERLRDLSTRSIKGGAISEKELVLVERNEQLYKRLRDQHAHLKTARMRLKALSSAEETIRSLRDDNRMLTSKVTYQSNLLRSLTPDTSKHREMHATMQRMSDENRQLKDQLEGLYELLSRFQVQLPDNLRQTVRDLVDKNAALLAVFESKGAQLQDALFNEKEGSEPALMRDIERLNEENSHLTKILQARELIVKFVDEQDKGREGNPSPIVEALEGGNQRLEQALRDREKEISLFAGEASNRPLLKTLQRLRDENIGLLKENAHKDQMCRQLTAEKKEFEKRFRDKHLLIRENRRLTTELDSVRKQYELLKMRDMEYGALKKEHAELRSKFQAVVVQYRKVSEKLAKAMDEYNVLMKEYENLFKR